MILWFRSFSEMNFDALMAVYEEGNRKHGMQRYPDVSEAEQLLYAEADFASYLTDVFFRQKGAAYCILADGDTYICAARIEEYKDGVLLTALETKPDCRASGNGKILLTALLEHCALCGNLPVYSHVDNKNVASMNLHLGCGFRILKDSARFLDGSVSTDSKTLIYEK